MAESTQPGTLKLYHIAIYRPSNEKAPNLKTPVGSGRFLFAELNGDISADATAKQKAEGLQALLPPGWELKITEVPFTVTRGTPILVGTCSRATCENFGRQVNGEFFCGICGEPLSIKLIATEE